MYQIYDLPQHRLWQSLFRGRRQFYREFRALQNVSFQVAHGEVVGIVGRNGSGKSTLLQLVCGTLTPTSGQVTTTGRVAALLELGAGFNPEFTGRENVYLNGAILGLTPREIDARYPGIVAFADIGPFIDQPIKTYSTGMVVRLAFAVVAHVDADVLVIDEALAVGDAFFVQKCMRFLREFMKTGTILFVSHDTGAVVNLCRRAIWLHQGELMMDGPARDVTEAYLANLAEEAYGVAPRRQPSQAPDPLPQPPAPDVDLDGRSFGKGGARIVEAVLLDEAGESVQAVVGDELVTLRIRCEVLDRLDSPIVGFIVKDRLGQVLFSDNTFLRYADRPLTADPGSLIEARFAFVMPTLAAGQVHGGRRDCRRHPGEPHPASLDPRCAAGHVIDQQRRDGAHGDPDARSLPGGRAPAVTVDRDARCEVCGHDAFVHDDVIWPELAREWELSAAEQAQIDVQQGTRCERCGINVRSQALARALLRVFGWDGTLETLRHGAPTPVPPRPRDQRGGLAGALAVAAGDASPAPVIRTATCGGFRFQDGSFDLVVHSDTLEHVPDTRRGTGRMPACPEHARSMRVHGTGPRRTTDAKPRRAVRELPRASRLSRR